MNLKRLKAGWDEKIFVTTFLQNNNFLMRLPCSRKKMAMIKEKHKDIRYMIHKKAVNNGKLLNKQHKKKE